jgi:hypothetical protein
VRPGRDADHSPHLVPRSLMSRSYTPLPLSSFKALALHLSMSVLVTVTYYDLFASGQVVITMTHPNQALKLNDTVVPNDSYCQILTTFTMRERTSWSSG